MRISSPTKAVRNLTLAAFLSASTFGQTSTGSGLPPYQLTEMKVVPYSQRTNTFLEEVKDGKGTGFWNELNLSLLVTIQVSGRAGSYSPDRRVEITAHEGG